VKIIIKDGLFSLGYSISSRAAILLTNLIAVRLLNVDEYGVVALYITIVTSIATLSTFGLGVTCNKVASTSWKNDPGFTKAIISSSLIASSILALAISISYWPFAKSQYTHAVEPWVAFLSIVSIAWVISATGVFEGALFGTQQYRKLFSNALIATAISLPITALSIYLFSITGAVCAIAGSRAVLMLMHLKSLNELKLISFDLNIIKKRVEEIKAALMKTSLPLAMSGALAGPTIAAVLTIVINEKGASAASYFAWPYQIYLVATFIPGAIGHFLISKFSRARQGRSKQLGVSIFLNVLLGTSTCTVMLVLKSSILAVAGSDYQVHAEQAFTLFAGSSILYGLNVAFISFWTAEGRAWLHFLAQIIWSVTLLVTAFTQAAVLGAAAIPLGFCYGYVLQAIFNYGALVVVYRRKESGV